MTFTTTVDVWHSGLYDLGDFTSVWFFRIFTHPTRLVMNNHCTKSVLQHATSYLSAAMSVSPTLTYDNPLPIYHSTLVIHKHMNRWHTKH